MYETTLLDLFPLWAVFAGSALLTLIATEIGLMLGKRRKARMRQVETLNLGSAVGATMGLLAFILAFTFSMGADRLDTKRAVALDQANAIGTALLRTDLLPEPQRGQARRLMYEYLDKLLSLAQMKQDYGRFTNEGNFAATVLAEVRNVKRIESELWQAAAAATITSPSPGTALFASAVNDAIDLFQTRITTSFQQRMLPIFWVILFSLAVMAIGLTGYDLGVSGSQRSLAQWVVAVAFAAIIFLVVAFDRPQSSVITDLPLMELRAELEADGA